jgi:hypothetical protein
MCSCRLLLLKRWFNLIFLLSLLRYKITKSFILKSVSKFKFFTMVVCKDTIKVLKIQTKVLKLIGLFMCDWAGYSLKFA